MLITLKEWAQRVGIDPITARQKAARGSIPAIKMGRDWVIEEDVKNIDHRRKENKTN